MEIGTFLSSQLQQSMKSYAQVTHPMKSAKRTDKDDVLYGRSRCRSSKALANMRGFPVGEVGYLTSSPSLISPGQAFNT